MIFGSDVFMFFKTPWIEKETSLEVSIQSTLSVLGNNRYKVHTSPVYTYFKDLFYLSRCKHDIEH